MLGEGSSHTEAVCAYLPFAFVFTIRQCLTHAKAFKESCRSLAQPLLESFWNLSGFSGEDGDDLRRLLPERRAFNGPVREKVEPHSFGMPVFFLSEGINKLRCFRYIAQRQFPEGGVALANY